MKEEFVTYKQALALKELGFDETCLAAYDLDYINYSTMVLYFYAETPHSRPMNFNCTPLISGPLKQQVFRWFREKYGLMGIIEGRYYNGKLMFTYVIFCRDIDFDTYEEAENACIDKLIEIAKQQSND